MSDEMWLCDECGFIQLRRTPKCSECGAANLHYSNVLFSSDGKFEEAKTVSQEGNAGDSSMKGTGVDSGKIHKPQVVTNDVPTVPAVMTDVKLDPGQVASALKQKTAQP